MRQCSGCLEKVGVMRGGCGVNIDRRTRRITEWGKGSNDILQNTRFNVSECRHFVQFIWKK